MKTISMFIVVFLLSNWPTIFISQLNSDCGSVFYYNANNEKIWKEYLDVYSERICIGFVEDIDFLEKKMILNKFLFLRTLTENPVNLNNNYVFVNTQNFTTCDNFNKELQKLIDHPKITYANPFLITKDGQLVVVNDFIVSLKDISQYEELQMYAEQTKTFINRVRYNNLVYLLSVDKNSNGNALQMANYFSETQKFRFASPNFMWFLQR